MRKIQELIAAAAGPGLIICGGLACAPLASAQDNAEGALEEIIVTAQKRSQALIEIPMSITVLSGESLERQQIDNFQDLVTKVPGLSLTTSSRGVTRVTLRGINTGGVATTVGVYVNDVPFGSSSGLSNSAILTGDFDTFDLDRIEVLRGPQGTLYGASSLGGVMRYVTNAPSTERFEFRGKAAVEDVDSGDIGYAFTGLVNAPISDTFAIRATGFYRADDGFIDSIGNNPIPSLTDPNINIVDGTRVEQNINTVDTVGGRVSALFAPSDRFSLNVSAVFQNIEAGSGDFVDADPATLERLNSDLVKSRYHVDSADIEYRVYSAALDWDIGSTTLQSITSYSTLEHDFRTDAAVNTQLLGLPTGPAVTLLFGDPVTRPLSAVLDQVTSTDKFAQEFRLVSADSDTFEWLVGLYYTDEDSAIDPQMLLAVEAGTDNIAEDIPPLVVAAVRSTYEEVALFANATWYLTPRFELSFGARQSDNDQTASQVLDGVLLGGTINFDNANSSESPFTWSFSPRFAINDDASLYARVATGFRPGGPNVLPPGTPPGTPGSYDSDRLTSYEAGLKMDSVDGRFGVDLSVYYLDWEDVQLFAVVNGVGINANGGTAVSKGLEFAATFRPGDNFTLGLNGAYTDAYLTQDTDPVVGGLDGDPLPNVPEWSYSLDGEYAWAVMGDATASIGADVGYVGKRPSAFGNTAPSGGVRELDSYATVNLRAGIEFDRWSVDLYARNLTNEEGINNIIGEGQLPNGAVGLALIRPRTIGVALTANF